MFCFSWIFGGLWPQYHPPQDSPASLQPPHGPSNGTIRVGFIRIRFATCPMAHAGADPGETLNLDSAEPLLSLGYPRLREARQGACQTDPVFHGTISSCRPFCHRFCHKYDLKRYTVANNHAISSSLSHIIFTAASLMPVLPPFPPTQTECHSQYTCRNQGSAHNPDHAIRATPERCCYRSTESPGKIEV